MSEYPECEKVQAVQKESQKIGEFLEWLSHEKKFTVCKWYEDEEQVEADEYYPVHLDIERLLAEFFGIDLDKMELEKRQMLDKIRGDQ